MGHIQGDTVEGFRRQTSCVIRREKGSGMNDTTNTKNGFVCKRNYTIQRYVGLGENSNESKSIEQERVGRSKTGSNSKKDNNNRVVWAI